MSTLKTIRAAEQLLSTYVPAVKELLGKDLTLERMLPLMEKLGNPERKLRIIHIAGTSGKTSTAYYMSALLQVTGYKTGLTVSPHVDSITERIQIDGKPLSEREFCDNLAEFMVLIAGVEPRPTYFELLVAFVYWFFAKVGVEYAVVETGLGGLYDGTNVASNSNKLCILTDIGLDHTHVLGNDIASITRQKVGIVYPGNTLIMYRQSDEIHDIVFEWCNRHTAKLIEIDPSAAARSARKEINRLPRYQQRNWLLAREALQILAVRDGLTLPSEDTLRQSSEVIVPGRMDVIKQGDKTIVMDGAHNRQKMQAFVESLLLKFPSQKFDMLIAVKKGKEYTEVLDAIMPVAKRIIVTTFDTTQDLPAVSAEPAKLARYCTSHGFNDVITIDDQLEAYQELLAGKSSTCVITGSFYLLGQLRHTIMSR